MKRLIILGALIVMIQTTSMALELPVVFSDNMVLQRDTKATFWGWAKADEKVDLLASWGEKISVITAKDGKWHGQIQTPQAGGPYQLEIKGSEQTIVIKNILIGEVWFCSGQSNMEMPLAGWPPTDTIMNSTDEIQNANYSEIRLFTVTRAFSFFPKDNCIGRWQPCKSQSAKSFSATAYFFGRKLYEELGVPIGLIHSSWGGTPVESWIDREHLSDFPEFKVILDTIASSKEKIVELEKWLEDHPTLKVQNRNKKNAWSELDFKDDNIILPAFNDQNWKFMNLPQNWEKTELGEFDGVVWFRKHIKIPENWFNKELVLELGPIDDMDVTYFNGVKIGGYEQEGFWQKNRVYSVPDNLVKTADNIIAVRVIDHQGGGGIYGKSEQMKIYPKHDGIDVITLAGEWKYLPIAEYNNGQFYLFDIETQEYYKRPQVPVTIGANTPTCLYNAMVHPVKPFAIKGVIWYQGESNTGNPEQYDDLFPVLIANWRERWQNRDLPFYYVQIAPYDYGEETRSQRLRESQMKALAVPHTGMAVTLDIGNTENIHPANKQEVGRRLALWALAKDYQKKLTYSGPIYKSMEIKDNEIIISFEYAENGLWSKDGKLGNFIIAGEDRNFKKADAQIKGNKLIVSHPDITHPVAVRYAWSNTAEATLFNKEGLPASTFRTDDW
jgi:sialate O-acetylesterase